VFEDSQIPRPHALVAFLTLSRVVVAAIWLPIVNISVPLADLWIGEKEYIWALN
jgi:hypothetical protein